MKTKTIDRSEIRNPKLVLGSLKASEIIGVLLIEDNPGDARLIREILVDAEATNPTPSTFRLAHTDRLSTGLARLVEGGIDVVLLDLDLPDSQGLDTFARAHDRAPEVPIVILTGLDDEALAVQAVQAGAQDYLVKGRLDGHSLVRVMRYAIERHRLVVDLEWHIQALQASATRLRRITESSPDSIIATDAQGRITVFNPGAEELLGYRAEEVLGRRVEQLYPSLEAARAVMRAMRADPRGHVRSREVTLRRKDGHEIPVLLSAAILRDGDGQEQGTVGYSKDLTALKQAEEQIQRQLQRLTALRSIDMTITASLDLRITLNVLLDQVANQLGVDAAAVQLLNPHTQTLEYAAGHGFRTTALQHTRLRLGEGHAGRAALERRIVSIPNLAEAEDGLRRAPLLQREAFITYYGVPLIAKGQVKGVLEVFHRAPLEPDPEWLDFLEALAAQAAIAIDNATLFDDLQRSQVELALAYDTTLEGWVHALDLRDEETEGHTQRVTQMTLRLAQALGVSDAELVHLRRGALLHDIGKMAIPDSILLKPGPLDDDEWEIMRQHPVYAYQWLSPIAYLRPALDIPYCHHEKWDGTGYPRGLKGEQIPLAARIFAVADVYDALRSDRPYRKAWPEEKVREYIREQAGRHFDPQVVEVFMRMEERR